MRGGLAPAVVVASSVHDTTARAGIARAGGLATQNSGATAPYQAAAIFVEPDSFA
jgi:hypothetical protein